MPARSDRGLRADGEHVAADREQRQRLRNEPREPECEHDDDGAARDDEHVAAADREQVVQTAGAEALLQCRREILRLAEHDAFEDRAAFSRQAGDGRADEPRVQAIGDAVPRPDDLKALARSTTWMPCRRRRVRSRSPGSRSVPST